MSFMFAKLGGTETDNRWEQILDYLLGYPFGVLGHFRKAGSSIVEHGPRLIRIRLVDGTSRDRTLVRGYMFIESNAAETYPLSSIQSRNQIHSVKNFEAALPMCCVLQSTPGSCATEVQRGQRTTRKAIASFKEGHPQQ